VSSKRVRLFVTLAVVFSSLPFIIGAGVGNDGNSGAARAEHQRVIDFWTPERVAQAVPRDFYLDAGTGRFSPAKKPPGTPGGGGGGGGGGGDTGVVSGDSWKKGGDIDGASGKVLFEMGGSYYVCSATAIDDSDDNDRSLIITAAHCVYDEAAGAFATYWVFVPDYDAAPEPLTTNGSFCGATAYGCWSALKMVVHNGYASAGGFNDQAVLYDFGVVAVGQGGHDMTLLETEVVEQGFDLGVDASNLTETGHAFGYPAQKRWKGTDLIYCRGPIDTDPNNNNETYRLDECKLNGGSSGGPWLIDFSESSGSGMVISVNSYGYNGINAMHGPKLNTDTQSVYDAALSGEANTTVS